MDECTPGTGLKMSETRILIKRPCRGYYLRWWYNGWHYWYFLQGRIIYTSTGQKYNTLGVQGVEISSGQVPVGLVAGVKTIMWSREVYLLNDTGWVNVFINPSNNSMKNNYINGFELLFLMTIGSCSAGELGYTPPTYFVTSDIFASDVVYMNFIYSEFDTGSAKSANILSPSPDFTVTTYSLSWAMVVNSLNKITVYPLSQNTGAARWGTIALNLPGYAPIYITVTQFQYLASQVFESDKTYVDFIWDYFGPGVANYVTLNVAPDQTITEDNTVSWATVSINNVTKVVTIYPNGKNDSIGRGGFVYLHCPDAPDIDITVEQQAIPVPGIPVATAGTGVLTNSFYANWNAESVSDGYYLDVAEDVAFTVPVAGFDNLDVGAVLTKQVTGLDASTDYWFRVRGYNDSGTSADSNTIKVTTDVPYAISLDSNLLYFSYDQICCYVCTVTVTSSHAWTAAWVSDDGHYTASRYSGTNGQTVVISTVANNETVNDFIQTLRFTCGTEHDDCVITQYKDLQGCPE